jgi:multiple sugar transport system permease protein
MKLGRAERQRAAWGFLAPALILIGTFFFIPVVGALVLSFTDFDLYSLADRGVLRWIGVANYRQLFANPDFLRALRNTFFYGLIGGPLAVAVSLGAALLVNAKLAPFKGFFRTVYFAPYVTTLVAAAVVWRFMLHTRYGLVNYGLSGLGIGPIDWLGDARWALPAIVLMSVWKSFGYNMVIFVAGLQTIPEELYEAASLDGAKGWTRFRHVTLPMLGPTLGFVGIITLINYIQLFAEPYVMTQGGPLRSTTSLVLLMYEEGFRWWRMGVAAAVAFVLFAIVLTGTLLQRRLTREEA